MSGHGNQDSDYFNNPAGEQLPALAQWVERCARICDEEAKRLKAQIQDDVWCGYADTGAMVCAHLIRKSALPVAPLVKTVPISDEQIEAWAERHDIAGDEVTLRAIFEDARSLFNLSAPLAERPQGERQEDSQEDSFNQPVNDAHGALRAASEPSHQAMPGSAPMGLGRPRRDEQTRLLEVVFFDLLSQVETFIAEQGEANFYTAPAHAMKARLQGKFYAFDHALQAVAAAHGIGVSGEESAPTEPNA